MASAGFAVGVGNGREYRLTSDWRRRNDAEDCNGREGGVSGSETEDLLFAIPPPRTEAARLGANSSRAVGEKIIK